MTSLSKFEARCEESQYEPDLVDAIWAIHRLLELTHLPHCRLSESNFEDEFIGNLDITDIKH